MRAGLVLGLFTALASCAVDDPATSVVEEHICGSYLCGANSPQINGIGDFYELNLNGLENGKHLVVAGFAQNNFAWTPHIVGGTLTVTRVNNLGQTITRAGSQLIGGRFILQQTTTQRIFAIEIENVVPVDMWAHPSSGPTPQLEAYVLDYFEFLNGGWGDPNVLCSNAPERGSPDLLGMNAFATLFFEGDRIGLNHVDNSIDTSWFNLGCAGHTLAKMALTGHTEAAKTAGTFTTTLDERTTMLRMLTADYCGNGYPWTVTGQQLRWADNHGTMHYNDPTLPPVNQGNAVLEARWTPNGAHCLVQPRVDVNPTPLAHITFGDPPNIYQKVMQMCPSLPVCTDQDFSIDGFHLATITPCASLPCPVP